MSRTFAPLIAVCAATLLVTGCASPQPKRLDTDLTSVSDAPGVKLDFAHVVYQAAQTVADRAVYLDKTRAVVVATVVSVDDLKSSSTFGRVTSQLIANRISQRGYLVRDVTYMRAVTVEPTGELVLTREAAKLSAEVKAQAVVAGTYAVGGKEVYLNLRMLNASTGEILSSADAVIPLDENVSALFGGTSPLSGKVSLDRFEEIALQQHMVP